MKFLNQLVRVSVRSHLKEIGICNFQSVAVVQPRPKVIMAFIAVNAGNQVGKRMIFVWRWSPTPRTFQSPFYCAQPLCNVIQLSLRAL